MNNWFKEAVFYHIYPLGFCGAPDHNKAAGESFSRLGKIAGWIGHFKKLGINALYLGPLFESLTHGYDTVNYFELDRRLGTNRDLKELISALHTEGIKVILDGVFNHVSRDFFAFRDVLKKREHSPYCSWFSGLNFSGNNPYNDRFSYDTWDGHHHLVKLNLTNQEVKKHLFDAVRMWISELGINGLRLDAADVMDLNFLQELASFCRSLDPDFFLTGEVVHGDYSRWAGGAMLDSATNYETYKGLYSSLNDKNYFEIAYALNRQFGNGGIYENLPLYNFVDNHDVTRAAHILTNEKHLYPLYGMLFTIPGIPSIYYGSEWGIKGCKQNGSDAPLRPELDLDTISGRAPHPDLIRAIQRFISCRKSSKALMYGDYKELYKSHEQLVFSRTYKNEQVIVGINASEKESVVTINGRDGNNRGTFYDSLNERTIPVQKGRLELAIPSCWLTIAGEGGV